MFMMTTSSFPPSNTVSPSQLGVTVSSLQGAEEEFDKLMIMIRIAITIIII